MGVILLRFAQNTKLWVCLCGRNSKREMSVFQFYGILGVCQVFSDGHGT